MKTYVTFGQVHRHKIDGKVFDRDCVAVIQADSYSACRAIAFELFGKKFCMAYAECDFNLGHMNYYPRGEIAAN